MKKIVMAIVILLATTINCWAGNSVWIQQDNQDSDGSIFIKQDGTGSRTVSYGSSWDFIGGTAPTLTTTASAVDRLDYIVRSSTKIHAVVTLAYS